MIRDLGRRLINSWDWLNSYCLSVRNDQDLACGKHAISIVQIDDFIRKKFVWGGWKTAEILRELESIIENYAADDNLIARYNDSTFVVVLHYLDEYSEIETICNEIKAAINDAELGGDEPLTVSIGASVCRHDPKVGYECAMGYALKALTEAHIMEDAIIVSDALK